MYTQFGGKLFDNQNSRYEEDDAQNAVIPDGMPINADRDEWLGYIESLNNVVPDAMYERERKIWRQGHASPADSIGMLLYERSQVALRK